MILLIVFNYCIALLSSSLGWGFFGLSSNRFTEEGKANLQKAAEERKSYPDCVYEMVMRV